MEITEPIPTKFYTVKKTTKYASRGQIPCKNPRWRMAENLENWPYLKNGLTDRHKICAW